METIVYTLGMDEGDNRIFSEAGAVIRSGGLVAFPTETVYGLGGDALRASSSEKIYKAKGRPSDNPLIVHICRMEDLNVVAQDIPKEAILLGKAFWPGPLTMILKKRDTVPFETTGGLDTVAVRMPSHPAALSFIEASGGFVAAPSANLSGRPSPTGAGHVIDDLFGRIDMIIDGGKVGIGLESTIVDLTEEVPTVLRPGYIGLDGIRAVLGEVRLDPALEISAAETADHTSKDSTGRKAAHLIPAPEVSCGIAKAASEDLTGGEKTDPDCASYGGIGTAGGYKNNSPGESADQSCVFTDGVGTGGLRPKAPGMKYRHYAPKGELTIIRGEAQKVAERINQLVSEHEKKGEKTGVLATEENLGLYSGGCIKCIGSRADEEGIAANLFGLLREFDKENVDYIYSEDLSSPGLGVAIMNRLVKAAGHRIMDV